MRNTMRRTETPKHFHITKPWPQCVHDPMTSGVVRESTTSYLYLLHFAASAGVLLGRLSGQHARHSVCVRLSGAGHGHGD